MHASLTAGAAALACGSALPAIAQDRGAALRVAHLTDPHVDKNPTAVYGFAAALQSMLSQRPSPAFILGGGDHILDALAGDYFEAMAQWDLYLKILSDHTRLKMYPLIGNHDIFAWGDPIIAAEMKGYGKRMAMDRLGLDRAYYSFDAGGWHFVCLDNIVRRGLGYYAAIDPDQLKWLEADLRDRPGVGSAGASQTPICIFSHVPFLSACALIEPEAISDNGFVVSDTAVQHDPRDLLSLLLSHNVKLCVSGHLHMVERVAYRGIQFICNGAVCGDWWQGPRFGHPPGYGLLDFWPGGAFEYQYVPYAWEPAKS